MNIRLPLCVALISASALAFEVQILRLLSVIHWVQFATIIIALALLGYSIAGVAATLGGQAFRRRRREVIFAAAVTLTVAIPLLASAIQWIPFNALQLIWEPFQLLWLGALFAVLALPFLAAGLVIVAAFQARPARPGMIYAADLIGAATGAWIGARALAYLPPHSAFGCCALLAAFGAMLAWPTGSRPRPRAPALALAAVATIVASLWALNLPALKISPYKGQSLLMAVSGSVIAAQRFGPDGYLAVVDNRHVPVRYAPGMSLISGHEPPPQAAVFRDGDSMTALARGSGQSAWLTETVAAAAYALGAPQSVAVLASGTGMEVERALALGAQRVDAVEHRSQLVTLTGEFGMAGGSYARDRVRLFAEAPRSWLARSPDSYDLVVFGTDDSLAASTAGINAANSAYLYTEEAIAAAWRRLKPDGRLAISQWLRVPPRQSLKLAVAIANTLRAEGIADPGAHLAVVRNWSVVCLVVSRRPLSREQTQRMRRFSQTRGFDLAWLPDLEAAEANRRNRWREPWLYNLLVSILRGDAAGARRDYRFQIEPASDDRPWFFNAFRWRTLPLLWEQRAAGGLLLLESGYLLVVANLALAALAGGLLLILPLRRLRGGGSSLPLWRVSGFFACIGLAFLGIEITLIEKMTLWLGRPVDAFATGVAGFLIGAGCGSALSSALGRRLGGPRRVLPLALTGLALWGALLAAGMGGWDQWILAGGAPLRVTASLCLVAPAGFAMGQFFPAALAVVGAEEPPLVPWAWAVNGAASVVASPLALLLSIHLGLRGVLLISLLFYLAALYFSRGWLLRAAPRGV